MSCARRIELDCVQSGLATVRMTGAGSRSTNCPVFVHDEENDKRSQFGDEQIDKRCQPGKASRAMFSLRTSWDISATPLAEAAARRAAACQPVLDLTESNPTRVGLGFSPAALREALADPRAARYEPDPLGLVAAREAIVRYYAERGHAVAPERIVVTASTSEAYAFLFKLLADPGDEVLVPEPSYPLFAYLAGLESVRTVGYPLRYDGEWHLDRHGLESALTARTRAIVTVSPNNPTGSFLKADELAFLAQVCGERGLALIADEVFSDYALDPSQERVETVCGTPGVLSFALSGISKIGALPQLKVGWMVASGPEALVEPAMRRLEVIADTYLSASTPSQLAFAELLARRAEAQQPLRERLRRNLETLRAACGPEASWQPLKVEGGWSAVIRVPRTRSEQEWALVLLEEDGVLVHPGFFFDFPGEAYLVLSLIVPPEEFAKGVAALARRIG